MCMTAIVGIMNKHAIAVAADSAETIGNGVKIYNKANKIFTLSKSHPVGIAICGGAYLSGVVPWELVIKQYRKRLGDKSFLTIKEYIDDFIAYLKLNNYFVEKEDASAFLKTWALDLWKKDVVDAVLNKNCDDDYTQKDFDSIGNYISNIINDIKSNECIDSLTSITKEEISKELDSVLEYIKQSIEKTLPNKYQEIENDIVELYTKVLTTKGDYMPMHTGLAFFGYGDADIYPTLINVEIGMVIADTLSWYISGIHQINNTNTSSIVPMAQTDIMHTIIGGIDPKLQSYILDCTHNTMQKFIDGLHDILAKHDSKMASVLSSVSLDPLMQELSDTIKQKKQLQYISPLLTIVSSLEKEDLADLAENLIYLTSLKRKITPTLETVGGPVDVAVVSKCDGFIWMKRKHYFDPNLNRCFFDNYYK